MKLLTSFSGIPIILFFLASSYVRLPGQTNTFQDPVDGNYQAIEQAALKEVATQNKIICETEFQVGEIQQDEDWAFLNLLCWPPQQTDPEVFAPTMVILAIAHNDMNEWNVYLQGDEMYSELLYDVPNTLLSSEAKEQLLQMVPAYEQQLGGPFTTGLPWQVGQTWYYRTSIHGSNNALDLASPCGTVGEVRAADSGVVLWATDTCMLVQRADGLAIGYQHLDSADIGNWNAGDPVNNGQLLGDTTLASGCSGTTGAHHVHFWLNNESPNGSTFGGWTLDDPYLLKDGQSRYPNLGCVASNALDYESPCCGCALANQNKNNSASSLLSPFAGLVPEGPASVAPLPAKTSSILPPPEPPTAVPITTLSRPPDYTPPNGRLQINGGGEVVNSLNVTVRLDAQDDNRVAAMRFSTDGETWTPWQPFTNQHRWQLANQPDAQTVYAQVKDEAGNISQRMEATVTAVLNVDPPSSAHYVVACSVMGLGGGTAASGSYTVRSTIGQPYDTTPMQGNSYQVHPGFETACSGENVAPITREVYLPVVVRP